jgi:hypothetical protein
VVDWSRTETPAAWDFNPIKPNTSACGSGEGKTFEVGTGKTYATPSAVPWLSLMPCDVVKIYYRSTPYTDIVFLASRGEKNKWITIEGVAGPNGERPVFDGGGAVMPKSTGASQWDDSVGMFIVQSPVSEVAPNRAAGYKPGYLHITGFKIQNAKPASKVTNIAGKTVNWDNFSSGIYAAGVEHFAVSNCELSNNGLGLFVNSTNDDLMQSRDIQVTRNYIYNNGNVGSFSEHNAYVEAIGTTYEYNYFGGVLSGSYGYNLKERSPGMVFRHNYVKGSGLALQDPDSNAAYERYNAYDKWGVDMNSEVFIYNNIFVLKGDSAVAPADQDSADIFQHGSGGTISSSNPQIRYGSVFFYKNRVESKFDAREVWIMGTSGSGVPVDDKVSLFTLANTRLPTTVDARMNLFHASSATAGATARGLALFTLQGKANFLSNWASSFVNCGYLAPWGDMIVGTPFDGSGLNGLTGSTASPGYVSASTGNYLTTTSSPFAGLSAAYASAVTERGLTVPAGVDPVVTPFGQ